MALTLTAGQSSLLRATRLMYQASRAAESESRTVDTFEVRGREFDVKCVLWRAILLLPDGLPLEGERVRHSGCVEALVEADAELRTLPLESYPDGVPELVVDLGDLIADMRAGSPA